MTPRSEPSQDPTLKDATTFAVEESRMVLPGVQALFGFQLIAVFNQRFAELCAFDRRLHLLALVMVALAAALLMAPAAQHRIAEQGRLSQRFLVLASRLISIALVPLAIGLTLDLFIVTALILADRALAAAAAAGIGTVLLFLWFGWPAFNRIARRRRD